MSFGLYLVGTFERRLGTLTQFQIVYPTVDLLNLHVFFFDRGGVFQHWKTVEVSPNALWEIDMGALAKEVPQDAGVAKFFSLKGNKLALGIIGFQRRVAAGKNPANPEYAALMESNLEAIPETFARPDYAQLRDRIP